MNKDIHTTAWMDKGILTFSLDGLFTGAAASSEAKVRSLRTSFLLLVCFSFLYVFAKPGSSYLCSPLCGPTFFTRMRPHSIGRDSLFCCCCCWKTI